MIVSVESRTRASGQYARNTRNINLRAQVGILASYARVGRKASVELCDEGSKVCGKSYQRGRVLFDSGEMRIIICCFALFFQPLRDFRKLAASVVRAAAEFLPHLFMRILPFNKEKLIIKEPFVCKMEDIIIGATDSSA